MIAQLAKTLTLNLGPPAENCQFKTLLTRFTCYFNSNKRSHHWHG